MPDLTLGQIVLSAGGLVLVVAGVLGLWPLLFPRTSKRSTGRLTINERAYLVRNVPASPVLIAPALKAPVVIEPEQPLPVALAAGFIPQETPPIPQKTLPVPVATTSSTDEGLVEELFAEMFSLRTALNDLVSEVRSIRVDLDARGRKTPVKRAA